MSQSIRFENTDSIQLEDKEHSISFLQSIRSRYNYMRVNEMFQKLSLKNISSAVIIALLLIIILFLTTSKNRSEYELSRSIQLLQESLPSVFTASVKYRLESKSLNTSEIFISDLNQIRIYNLETNKDHLYHENTENIETFDITGSSVYFTENGLPVIQSTRESDTEVKFSKRVHPQAMAVDHLTKKFYMLDNSAGTVNVIDFEGQYFGIILSDLEDLHDIVLDVEQGLMFVVQNYKSILRANMDGTNLQEIVKNIKVTAMTIDRARKQIFWYDDQVGIVRANYEGKNRVVMMESHIAIVTSLVYHENYLFFLHPLSYSSFGVKIRASLWSCKIKGDACVKDRVRLPILFHDPKVIKTFVNYSNVIENPCEINNGNCTDLCLLSSNKSKSCACRVGYRLTSDLQNCEPVNDVILYLKRNYVKAIAEDSKPGSTFKDVIVPKPLHENWWFPQTSFYYDEYNDNFYFYEEGAIKVTSVMSINQTDDYPKIIMNNVEEINGIVYDHASSNLYYTSNELLTMVHFKPNGLIKKNLMTMQQGFGINSLNIDPNNGRIVFSDRFDFYSNTDGSNVRKLKLINEYPAFHLVTLDHDDNAIYTLYNGEITVNSFESDEFTHLESKYELPLIQDPKSISVYKEYLFVFNETGIWRADKMSGDNFVKIFENLEDKIHGIKVFSTTKFLAKIENECSVGNGNCEHFCFAKPEKTCACMNNYLLENDGSCKNF